MVSVYLPHDGHQTIIYNYLTSNVSFVVGIPTDNTPLDIKFKKLQKLGCKYFFLKIAHGKIVPTGTFKDEYNDDSFGININTFSATIETKPMAKVLGVVIESKISLVSLSRFDPLLTKLPELFFSW